MTTAPSIRRRSTGGFGRRRASSSASARADFDAWLAADPAHARAYADISGMFAQARALRPARREAARAKTRPRLAAAAALLAASVAVFAWFDDLATSAAAPTIATGVGERRIGDASRTARAWSSTAARRSPSASSAGRRRRDAARGRGLVRGRARRDASLRRRGGGRDGHGARHGLRRRAAAAAGRASRSASMRWR